MREVTGGRRDLGGVFTCKQGDKGERACHSCITLSYAHQLGDYGYFSESGYFCIEGNLFSELRSLTSEVDITPRQKAVNGLGVVDTGSSLPNNPVFNSVLASLSPPLTNSYLVTRIARYRPGECRA